jgi:hypothetical protein
MDETQTNNWDSWIQARLGQAIDVGIDRVVNKPQVVYDSSQAYGVDERGNLYMLGQNNGQVAAQGNVTVGGNSTMLLLVIGAVVLYMSSK